MFARRELAEDAVQAARMVGPLEADDARLVMARRLRDPGPGEEDEAGLIVRMVLHVLGDDDEAVALGGEPGRDRRRVGRAGLPEHAGRVGGGVRRPLLHCGQGLGQVLLALGEGMGVGRHRSDVGEPGARTSHQVEMDVHDDLPLDVQVDIVDEPVDGGAHGALDGVLNGHEPEVGLTAGNRLEDGRDRSERPQVRRDQVRLGHHRLMGEGGGWAEVGDRGRRRVHSWAG